MANEQQGTGNKYVEFYAAVTNVNSQGLTIGNQFDWKVVDSNNDQHGPAPISMGTSGIKMIASSSPGQKAEGTLIFEIPQNTHPVALVYSDTGNNNLTIAL